MYISQMSNLLTSPSGFLSPVLVLLWNATVRAFPPGGAAAALLSLLSPAAAG